MPQNHNIFTKHTLHSRFAVIAYRMLTQRRWVSYGDVMKAYMEMDEDFRLTLASCKGYQQLKRAFCEVCDLLRQTVGDDCIEEKGTTRNKYFRYVGTPADPLAKIWQPDLTRVEIKVLSETGARLMKKYFADITPVATHLPKKYDGRSCGHVTFDVEIDEQFYALIFCIGNSIEIVSPQSVRDELIRRLQNMNGIYL